MMLQDYLAAQCLRIEEELSRLIPEKLVPYHSLFEAARYSLLGGGKRLRPILALAAAEALGGSIEKALTPSCALEMIHTYSLIHDDLPCMDDDDFRRGKPSLHKAYPEGHAVLAGDFLLTYAFDILANDPRLTEQERLQLIQVLAKRSGAEGMIGGQVMDVAAEEQNITLDVLEKIHHLKTGAMIIASLEFGAITANASLKDRACLAQFGKDIGLAFQIVDDILDVTNSEAKHGRKVASDQINGKTTYVSLLGLEKSKIYAHELTKKAIEALKSIDGDTTLLSEIALSAVNRKI